MHLRTGAVPPTELVLGVTLVVAGLFQFSRLEHACLTACRSPWAFLWQHYRRGVRGDWTLGVRHGVLCLGCCWALMLIMFRCRGEQPALDASAHRLDDRREDRADGIRLVTPMGGALVLAGVAVSVLAVSAVPNASPGSAA